MLPALVATAPQPFLAPLLLRAGPCARHGMARRSLEPSGMAEKHQEAGFDVFFLNRSF